MEGYVLQQEFSPREVPLYPKSGRFTYPKTVIIPDSPMLVAFRKWDLLERSTGYYLVDDNEGDEYYWGVLTERGIEKTEFLHFSPNRRDSFGLEVPPKVASFYQLKEGDQVGIAIDRVKKLVVIVSVNGCQDPKVFTGWPPDLSGFQSDYPLVSLPVEKYGDFDLRVMTLLAPIGLGSSYWIIAPGGTGKTWLLVKIFDACLRLTREIKDLYVMMGYVGDRPEDAAQYLRVLEDYKCPHAEFHQAPWDTKPEAQVDVARLIMNRARRLTATGKHVVVLFDSISRIVAAHTASSYVDKESGMIPGGIYRDSLTQIIALMFGTHGSFGYDRSLTIIGTVLAAGETKRTSESAVDQETSDSSTTGVLRLVRIPTLERPWTSVNEGETYTRFPYGKDFRSEEQRREMEQVKREMRTGMGNTNSYEAHQRLLKYARKNQYPNY